MSYRAQKRVLWCIYGGGAVVHKAVALTLWIVCG